MNAAPDDNERHMNGSLPHDPFGDADPFDDEPASEPIPRRPARTIVLTMADEIAKPLPAVPYLIEPMGLASGGTACVAGYGFTGKTVSLQALALGVAAGRPIWGVWSSKLARVLHLDYEQGKRITNERYQRLARAAGIDLRSLGDRLQVGSLPDVYLDAKDGPDAFARAVDGHGLAIVDSFRAVAPSVDENSSEVRRHIDQLGRVSEKTGAVIVFIHHSRKPKSDDPEGAKYKLRGSGALFDACSSVFVLEGAKGQPTRVAHEKCRNRGVLMPDFGLRIEDVEFDGNPLAGLRVVHMEAEQMAASGANAPSKYTGAIERIGEVLRSEGEFRGSRSSLFEHVRPMSRQTFFAALAEMESRGLVLAGKDELGLTLRWTGPVVP